MATKLVTRDQVFELADELYAAGQNVSIVAVHKLLGRGSYTTVSKHLQEWKSRNSSAPNSPETPAIPETIGSSINLFAGKLWVQAVKEADSRYKADREQQLSQAASLESDIKEAMELADRKEAERHELQEKLEAIESENKALQDQLSQVSGQLKNKDSELAHYRDSEEKLTHQVAGLTEALDKKKEELMEYRSEMDREASYSRAETQRAKELEDRLTNERGLSKELREQLAASQSKLETLENRLSALQRYSSEQCSQLETEIRGLIRERSEAVGQLGQQNHIVKLLQQRILDLEERLQLQDDYSTSDGNRRQPGLFTNDDADS